MMNEHQLRRVVSLLIQEGVFDGKMGTGKATPLTSKEKSNLQKEQEKSLNVMLKAVGSRLRAAISPIEDEVDEIAEEELFDSLKEFAPKKIDKETAAKAAYCVFKVSIRRLATPSDLSSIVKKNSLLRSALMGVPGMMELQDAVNLKLEMQGKDPEKSINEAWAALNELIKQLSLVK